MRIFGLNILTDESLNRKINSGNFDNILKVLKIKKLYRITSKHVYIPKCNKCDENREFTVTLPDGRTVKEKCSCNKKYWEYSYYEVNPKDYYAIVQRFDNKIWIARDLRQELWNWEKKFIDNVDEPSESCFYTTKSKAQKAVDILNEQHKNRLF